LAVAVVAGNAGVDANTHLLGGEETVHEIHVLGRIGTALIGRTRHHHHSRALVVVAEALYSTQSHRYGATHERRTAVDGTLAAPVTVGLRFGQLSGVLCHRFEVTFDGLHHTMKHLVLAFVGHLFGVQQLLVGLVERIQHFVLQTIGSDNR